MKKRLEYRFEQSREFLLEQYCSSDFYQQRMALEGVDDVDTHVNRQDDAVFELLMEREVHIHTDKAPAFIRKIADNMLNGSALITTTVSWQKTNGKGRYVIKAGSMPVQVKVDFSLQEEGTGKCLQTMEVDIKASIPLLGKRLEQFMMPKAEKLLLRECAKSEEYFDSLA